MHGLKFPYQNLSLRSIKGEKWKNIPGLEDYFKISSYGRVKRLAYDLAYIDGRVYQKPSKIIKPIVLKINNYYVNDIVYFLNIGITLFKQKYYFSIGRLVYYCFVQSFDLADENILILPKDGNGLNIRLSNLIKSTHHDKQKRIYKRKRSESAFLNKKNSKKGRLASRIKNSKIVTQYSMGGEKIKTYLSVVAAVKATGISHGRICYIAGGKEISAGGFMWNYGDSDRIKIREDGRKNKR